MKKRIVSRTGNAWFSFFSAFYSLQTFLIDHRRFVFSPTVDFEQNLLVK